MTPELLWTNFPLLWHMAEPGSWPSIRAHGLFSTSALLEHYKIAAADRVAIERGRRPECVPVTRNGLPRAVIRDQKPMSDGALRKCLEGGLSPRAWYRILNARTFFWLSRKRLRGLLGARAYRNRPQTVLTIDTRSLVEAHLKKIELSPINSGSTIFKPVPRGRKTFRPIAKYDFEFWRQKRGVANAVVELIVLDKVPDIKDHVIAVHDATETTFTEKWRRKGTDPSIGP